MKQTVEDRFWSKVNKTATCWEWTASIRKDDGYGAFTVTGDRTYRAHQFSYILTHGSIPAGRELNHICSNRICVRPDHLEALTHAEHMRKTPGTFGYKWAQRTHCDKGHELSGDNLLPFASKKGYRRCRTCSIETSRKWRTDNPDKMKAAVDNWKSNNRERKIEYDRAYHARKRSNFMTS